MWLDSPRVLGEPVKILGLELEDVGLVGLLPLLLQFVLDGALPCFGIAIGTGIALYFAKRGKPPGHHLHTLHALELWRLPGIQSPKERRFSPW